MFFHLPRNFDLSFFFCCLLQISAFAQNNLVEGNLIQFNDNGAWCWYQDERAVVDIDGNKLILGSDASDNGFGGSPRRGDVEAVIFNFESGISRKYLLKDGSSAPGSFYADDHNAPAFLVRPDGRYVSLYAPHFNDTSTYIRIFDGAAWGSEVRFNWNVERPGGSNFQTTYSNVYYLASEDRVYNFVRGNNKSPNFMVSPDLGDTWSYGGQLTRNDGVGYNNGYYRYCSNGEDRIDFLFTEYHPRDYNTSIYHGYLKNGKTYKSDGTLVDDNIFTDTFIPTPVDFTLVFAANSTLSGIKWTRLWNADVYRYDDGTIAAIIKGRANDSSTPSQNPDNRLLYCRFNGSVWSTTYLGKAGPKLYASEQDYTGLGAIHPDDPNTIYISTSFDPRDSTLDLGVHEIFKGVTSSQGASWNWTQITSGTVPPAGGEKGGNLRPVIPKWDPYHTAVLWFRGTYFSAQSFDAAVVGIIESRTESVEKMLYTDAEISNTTLLNGSSLITTGPDSNQGLDDNQWHQRTGFGTGGSVFTSSENGDGEDVPALRTKINISRAGTYDVWINFWTNPDEDWRIRAGLSEDHMQLFRTRGAKQVEPGDHFSPVVLTGSGNTFLYQAYIGRVYASENDSFNVFIDDEAMQVGSGGTIGGARTWYDGVSCALVTTAVVPVELTGLTAKSDGKTVQLFWETQTETNNRGFEIERFSAGRWNRIGFVEGQGTKNSITSYFFSDKNPGDIKLKYRLKQIDFNGSFVYSDVTEVSIIGKYQLSRNYPNPFNPVTRIEYSIPHKSFVTLEVYDVIGNRIAVLVNEEKYPGVYAVSFDASSIGDSGLSSGVYYYRIKADDFIKTGKMLLLK